jgi:hypothetical protein
VDFATKILHRYNDRMTSTPEQTVSEKIPSERRSTPINRSSTRRLLKADQNGVLIAGGAMAGIGWVLLYQIVNTSTPLALYRWLFFIFLYMAVTGTMLPFIWYINRLFSASVRGGTILRQGMWFGLYTATIAWLQMIRALNGSIALLLGAGIFLIEMFLVIRERSHTP